jgi:hypothetical protein
MSHKIGLAVMILPLAFLLIFSITYGLNEYYDLASNLGVTLIMGMPCLLLAAISWLWPRRGGAAAATLSLLLLILSVSVIMISKVPPPGQQYPNLTFTEIAVHILPYAILFCGSIIAFILALKKKVESPDWLLKLMADGVGKLRATGLLTISLLGVIVALFFIIAIIIGGDSVPVANMFTGLIMGLTFATPLLFIIIGISRWPRQGGAVVGVLSIIALIFLVIRLIIADSSGPVFSQLLNEPLIFAAGIVLTGSILVFASARRY